jgi:hypothetical protein
LPIKLVPEIRFSLRFQAKKLARQNKLLLSLSISNDASIRNSIAHLSDPLTRELTNSLIEKLSTESAFTGKLFGGVDKQMYCPFFLVMFAVGT